MNKPKMYDEIEVNEFDFVPLALGGHKGIIMGAEEYESPITHNVSLKISVDTSKDDSQPEYFAEQYRNNTNPEKKWPTGAIKYVSLKEDENCVRMLKSFLTAVENSNPNFTFDWDKDVNQLKGKKIGLVFGLEEYEAQDGTTKTATKLNQFRSIDKVDNVKIPKVRMLDGSYVEYEEYTNKKETKSIDAIEVDGSMLPF